MKYTAHGVLIMAMVQKARVILYPNLRGKGLYATSGTVEGKTVKNIVKGYTAEPEFMEVNEQEPIPFT